MIYLKVAQSLNLKETKKTILISAINTKLTKEWCNKNIKICKVSTMNRKITLKSFTKNTQRQRKYSKKKTFK